jgi:hypothetical protein
MTGWGWRRLADAPQAVSNFVNFFSCRTSLSMRPSDPNAVWPAAQQMRALRLAAFCAEVGRRGKGPLTCGICGR